MFKIIASILTCCIAIPAVTLALPNNLTHVPVNVTVFDDDQDPTKSLSITLGLNPTGTNIDKIQQNGPNSIQLSGGKTHVTYPNYFMLFNWSGQPLSGTLGANVAVTFNVPGQTVPPIAASEPVTFVGGFFPPPSEAITVQNANDTAACTFEADTPSTGAIPEIIIHCFTAL